MSGLHTALIRICIDLQVLRHIEPSFKLKGAQIWRVSNRYEAPLGSGHSMYGGRVP